MIVLLSPAKTLNFDPTDIKAKGTPQFKDRTAELVDILKKKSAKSIGKLMHISEKLADENYARYQSFSSSYTKKNSKPALFTFKGDVYVGLEAENFTAKQIEFAQDHVRILSGLYGILKPLDKMQAYRLEMGTKLKNKKGANLYKFWGDDITNQLNKELSKEKQPVIINLASKEYYKAINPKALNAVVYDIGFKEYRNGKLMFVSFNAKKARGTMTRYIVQNKVSKVEQLKGFDVDGYHYDESLSTEKMLMFVK